MSYVLPDLAELAKEDADAIRSWLKRCGVQYDLHLKGFRRDGGADYELSLTKDMKTYRCLDFGLGSGWGENDDMALAAGIHTLYPTYEPDGWNENWEDDVKDYTTSLHTWLKAVDITGEILEGIQFVEDLESGDEYRGLALNRLHGKE